MHPNRPVKQSRVRFHLSGEFLYGDWTFAGMASAIEGMGCPSKADRLRHRSMVIASVLSAVSFSEACINELYVICAEHPDDIHVKGHPQDSRFQSIGEQAITQLGALWGLEVFQRNAKLLEKYQTALCIAGRPRFELGGNPYQDAQLVIQLRNILVHFKPEEQEVALGAGNTLPPDELACKCRGKFPINPLALKHSLIRGPDTPPEADYPFFPEKCLGSGCAQWAYSSCLSFVDEFFTRMGTTWYYHWLFDRGLLTRST